MTLYPDPVGCPQVESTGRLDVLFNNAGAGFATRIEDIRPQQFEDHIALHLFSTVNACACFTLSLGWTDHPFQPARW